MSTTALPQLGDKVFLADGGLETVLIFHEGIDLPCFAAFDLLKDDDGVAVLRNYYRPYIDLALRNEMGFILDTPTWRASGDWMRQLGHTIEGVRSFNVRAVELMQELRSAYQTESSPMVISGAVGPRGDGYVPGVQMTASEAQDYHSSQIGALVAGGVDFISAVTLNYIDEALGVVRAAQSVGIPVTIGFTTETDGCLPDGDSLREAITRVDRETDNGPSYYMINCAHVDHFKDALDDGTAWASRVRAVRANASRMSHAELDEADELDDGNPDEFGALYADLKRRFGNITVIGGCCGTDHRHIGAVCVAIL